MSRLPTVCFFLLVACVANPASSTTTTAEHTVIVDSVADGDSFRAGAFEIRLLGVNAPEQDECFGTESRQWLEEAIDGQSVRLDLVDVDQFGRDLANVFVGDRWMNLKMVDTGHALALTGREELMVAEEHAYLGRVGMWGIDICGASGPLARLAITDVDFDPVGTDDQETVIIRNEGNESVELKRFQLRDESSINRLSFLTSFSGAKNH